MLVVQREREVEVGERKREGVSTHSPPPTPSHSLEGLAGPAIHGKVGGDDEGVLAGLKGHSCNSTRGSGQVAVKGQALVVHNLASTAKVAGPVALGMVMAEAANVATGGKVWKWKGTWG